MRDETQGRQFVWSRLISVQINQINDDQGDVAINRQVIAMQI